MNIPLYVMITVTMFIIISAVLFVIIKQSSKAPHNKSVFGLLARYMKVFYSILFLLLIVFFLLFTYRFFTPDHPNDFAKELVHDVDYTGLTIGIIGIIVGLITVIYVEKQNEKSDDRVNDALSKLSTASTSINGNVETLKNITDSIHRSITNLAELNRITEIFQKVSEIIEDADSKSNDLYVLTHLTDFGQFLIRNVGILTRETQSSVDDYKNLSGIEFFDTHMRHFIKLKETLNDKMERYVTRYKEMKIAVLRNEKLKPAEPDKLKPFIVERIMRGRNVKLINKTSNNKIDYENYNEEDIYVHIPSNNDSIKFSKPQDILIKDILRNDCDFIDSLLSRSGNNLNIETVDYVPFQFFLSAPKDINAEQGWFAIIIFSNYYSLGYENSVVSFHSRNPTLCKGLRQMFDKLIVAQKAKDEKSNPIKKLFAAAAEINIALKCIDLDNDAVIKQIGFNSVTPVPDIIGKDDLMLLFKDADIKFNPVALYVKKNTEELKQIIANSIDDKTYFSVGVFYNPLTQALSDLDGKKGNPLFKLEHRDKIEAKNKIRIAVGGTIDNPNYETYEEVFDDKIESSFDYAFFCKLKVNNRFIFVGGGVNYFGSRHIEDCIKYGASKIKEQVIDKPFIMFFKVHSCKEFMSPLEHNLPLKSKESLADIDILLTSYVEDGYIKCINSSGNLVASSQPVLQAS